MFQRSVEQLREEIAQIDRDLARLTEQESAAGRIVDELALPAHRGDAKAKSKLSQSEQARVSALHQFRRLQSARAAIEGELQMAMAVADHETMKEKAREAKKIVAQLRNRGADVDATIRKLIDEYDSIVADVAALAALGASQINLRLVQLGCERALRAKLASIKELELRPVAPLERREFASLTDAWAAGGERWINSILNAEEPTTPTGADRSVAEQAQAGA